MAEPERTEHDLIILSDLHLSAGYNRRTGTYDRNEDFFYDAAFSRFIDVLLQRAHSEGRAWQLVILGDLADFLQVELPERRAGLTSAPTSVAKLEVIARGHPDFFRALARFVAAGFPVAIVIGNHDIELIWPEVQARFRALLAEHGAVAVEQRVTFHPWIFYRPGLVYAEHGQQYDGVNSFATLLQPQLPYRPEVIELPFGSFFVLYLFNYIERLDPFADNVKPVTRYLIWALRTRPIKVLATFGYHLRFFSRVLRKTSPLTRAQQQARRERYRREVLRPAAATIGLPPDVLEAIDRLAAVPALSSRWRQIVALWFDPLLAGGPLALVLWSLYQAVRRLRAPRRSWLALIGALAGLLWRERRLMRPATDPGGYLHRAARAIDELLTAHGLAVPAYVFGHTHTAERAPLRSQDEMPRYFNTGTWTPIVPQTFDLLGTRERFTFVQITRDPHSGAVLPELLVWNDAAGRIEPLPLL